MARQRRSSATLDAFKARLQGIKQISPVPNLPPNLSLAALDTAALSAQQALDAHNALIIALDDSTNQLAAKERQLEKLYTQALSAIAAQYGKDSSEYELAGGTRTSERKKSTHTPPKL
ncbi:hypothetical protein [Armatimonas sp.]|uniref:hypothetical protein n=1 Tax=Armatimonas sp. TaxID=1872638 RepID=UPI003752D065